MPFSYICILSTYTKLKDIECMFNNYFLLIYLNRNYMQINLIDMANYSFAREVENLNFLSMHVYL